ncbi:universal stress protein [Azospirillum halopraeferens]|uniref:universal stress protein n=1 Tax=Azospirillum halopraeferens TaxID=34010 RepID=UPI00048EF881|nr:universal stress protein [Azospirillum halopraeferens]
MTSVPPVPAGDDVPAAPPVPDPGERVFLVVVDSSPELGVAILFACRRAARTGGRVALLYVIEPEDTGSADIGNWMGVGDVMRQEAREEAEITLGIVSERIKTCSGKMPMFFIREGNRAEELIRLIREEKSISVLVLAAGTGAEGPGPLVSNLTGKNAAGMRVPVTIVPGSLSREEIEAIT